MRLIWNFLQSKQFMLALIRDQHILASVMDTNAVQIYYIVTLKHFVGMQNEPLSIQMTLSCSAEEVLFW